MLLDIQAEEQEPHHKDSFNTLEGPLLILWSCQHALRPGHQVVAQRNHLPAVVVPADGLCLHCHQLPTLAGHNASQAPLQGRAIPTPVS